MLAPVAERQAALEARHPRWVPRGLHEQLDAAAAEHPDRPYLVTDERTWTYAEVADWSVRIARGLVGLGVAPGERVALVMANHPEFVATKLGISRAGATAVPVNFLNRRDELGYVLRQSGAVALVVMDRFRDNDHLGMLDELAPGWAEREHAGGDGLPALRRVVVRPSGPGVRPGVLTLDALAATAEGWEPVAGSASDVADVLYTSGTTGSPKGVRLTHDMLLRTAYGSAHARAFQDGRRVTFSLPLYHVYGYVEGMLAVLFVGGAIIPQLTFTARSTLAAVDEHRADDALLIPTMTAAVLDVLREDGPGQHDVSGLSSIISSGGQSPAGIWDEIDELLGPVEVTTGYGMSETTASTTVTRPDDPPERRRTTNGRLRDVGVAGEASLGGRLAVYRVVDQQTGAELPRGEVGELQVRGPGVTSGYHDKPEEDAAAFTADGWFRTGDLGTLDAEDYLTLVGRAKDCYRCGAEQVVPKEVEDVLTAHPAVAQAHVVGVPDARMGEVGVAWVVARDGAEVDPAALLAHCAARLAKFKVPRHVRLLSADEVPLTPSGRPRKFLLAERARAETA
ncbi:AMP-binding protein [Rhodococcus aerolatus]